MTAPLVTSDAAMAALVQRRLAGLRAAPVPGQIEMIGRVMGSSLRLSADGGHKVGILGGAVSRFARASTKS